MSENYAHLVSGYDSIRIGDTLFERAIEIVVSRK
jgi:hypothetical protein